MAENAKIRVAYTGKYCLIVDFYKSNFKIRGLLEKVPRAKNYLAPLLKYCNRGSTEPEIILEPVPSDSEEQPGSLLEQLQNDSEDENNPLHPRQLFVNSPKSIKSHSINVDQIISETF